LLDLELDEVEPMSDVDTAGLELDDELPRTPSDEEVSEELTNNIKHDLEPELNDELDELLGSTDNDIALEETSSDEEMFGESDDPLDALGLLDGADEVETKLDLARAYIDMGDLDGAKDILSEIQQEGSDEQVEEARSLMEGLS
jgi:pilus assembly protein FimV